MKVTKRVIAVAFAVLMVGSALVGCTGGKTTGNSNEGTISPNGVVDNGTYTYHTSIGTSTVHTLNPHEWEYQTEFDIMELTQRGLYDIIFSADNESGYEIISEMAAELAKDVTAEYAGNEKYGVPADAKEGYAYEIKLRENAVWEDGTPINADTYVYSLKQVLDPNIQAYRASTHCNGTYAFANAAEYYDQEDGIDVAFEDIGFFKKDDYTIVLIYELPMANDYMFYWNLTNNWLVKEDIYEGNKQDAGGLTKTTYGTSVDTYASYGPYKLVEWQEDKVIKLTKNDKWYGWTLPEFEGQYQTTDVVYDIIDEHSTNMQLFMQGKLDYVLLDATDLETYGTSDFIVYFPRSHSYKLSFNTGREALEARSVDGINKLLMLYPEFRKAVSLSIDRAEFCQQVYPAQNPSFGLLNEIYIYDTETGAAYRDTEQAKDVLCDVYAVESYDELSGYNVEEAKKLYEEAYQAALAAGDITATDKVVLQLNVSANNETDVNATNFINDAVQAATKGTSLEGRISVEMLQVDDYYASMKAGTADLIFSAWGGNEVDPYSMMECYCNFDYYCDGEYGFDNTEEVTMTIGGKEYTYSYYDWFVELYMGQWAAADTETRLEVLAALEGALLKNYHTLPLRSLREAYLLSQKVEYVTYDFDIMTIEPFGGFRFMTYNYNDEEWEEYCAEQNNQLEY